MSAQAHGGVEEHSTRNRQCRRQQGPDTVKENRNMPPRGRGRRRLRHQSADGPHHDVRAERHAGGDHQGEEKDEQSSQYFCPQIGARGVSERGHRVCAECRLAVHVDPSDAEFVYGR